MTIWLTVIDIAGGLILGLAGFWYVNVRPERARRRRFFDEALGHDGADGLPRRDSIFERLDEMQTKLAAPILNGKGDHLITTVARLDSRTARQGREMTRQGRQIVAIRERLNMPTQRDAAD